MSVPTDPTLRADSSAVAADQRETLTVAEERASIGVVRRDTGGKSIRIFTETDDAVLSAEAARERVEITRHPVNREVDAIPASREEDGLTIIPVVEERAVVVTRLVVTEEIHIRRVRETEPVELPVTLRRQRVDIDDLAPAGETGVPPRDGTA